MSSDQELQHPRIESRLSRKVHITIMHPDTKTSIVHGTASKRIYWRPYALSWNTDKQYVNPNRDVLHPEGFIAVALRQSNDRRVSFDFFLYRRTHEDIQVEVVISLFLPVTFQTFERAELSKDNSDPTSFSFVFVSVFFRPPHRQNFLRSWSILFPFHFTGTIWTSVLWKNPNSCKSEKIEMTRCTETGADSQFGDWFLTVNLLFNRIVSVSHANVSNWESVTQIFPVCWWLIGVVSDRIYTNIDLNHVTTLSILFSFW